jgi:hypothetical protein
LLSRHAVPVIVACLLACLATTHAVAIRGGTEPAADEPGARATVMVTVPHGACSGLVYGDSFVITAAHCLADHDLKSTVQPDQVTITYGRSLKDPDAVMRKAAAVAIEENFLKQFAAWLGSDANLPEDDMPLNQEDIGLIRISGAHPARALSAALPAINNEYVVCCLPRIRTWPLVWLDVYGFGAAPKGETLHKMRIGTSAPDMVHRGRAPNLEQPYLPRQMMVRPDDLSVVEQPSSDARGVCHGDSGGPAFFVTTTRSRAVPRVPIKLIKGQPLAAGILSHTFAPDECSGRFAVVRLDYYRDWILAHVKLMK